jgi:metal-sulfur cluster biosynthetic enzyme
MSIVELGLVYDVTFENGTVFVTMTLTSGVPARAGHREGIREAAEIPEWRTWTCRSWNPPWDPRTMASDDVKMMLGIW